MKIVRTTRLLSLVLVWSACGDNLRVGDDVPELDATVPDGASVDAPITDATQPDASLRPAVVSTSPADLAMNVPLGARVVATFSRAMNPASITMQSFTLRQGATPIAGTVTYDDATFRATFAPTLALDLSRPYTATVAMTAADPAGNTLAADHVWTFTTGACAAQLPVPLLTAGNFAVLAGSTVTNVGLTTVTGDLGVSPGSDVAGFPPGIIVGARHAGNPVAAQGVADLTTAYGNAAGRTQCPVSVAGNLGGQTLPPGLYKSTSSLEVSSGDLTLDAQGDASAVFIFQTASTLTLTAGRQVVLTGGALPGNVYWQVGTSAVLGTTSMMKGTIMADQSISLATGARLDGRALARIAAVTLEANVVVRP